MKQLRPTMGLIALCIAALGGCGGTDSENADTTEPTEGIAQLESDYGGPDGVRQLFDTSAPEQIQQVLASYGIGYVVHPIQTAETIEREQAKAISDCAKYFPSADRTTWHNFNGECAGSARPPD